VVGILRATIAKSSYASAGFIANGDGDAAAVAEQAVGKDERDGPPARSQRPQLPGARVMAAEEAWS
jgi:hypothetical protein